MAAKAIVVGHTKQALAMNAAMDAVAHNPGKNCRACDPFLFEHAHNGLVQWGVVPGIRLIDEDQQQFHWGFNHDSVPRHLSIR